MKDEVQTPYMRMWKEEGILYCVFIDKLMMDIHVARHCVEERIAYSRGRSYPCFIDMRGLLSADKAARDYLAEEGAQLIKAGALIVGSVLTQALGNIFLLVNKPKVPTRLFSDENLAKKWLRQFVEADKINI